MAETMWLTSTWQAGRAHLHTLPRHRFRCETIQRQRSPRGVRSARPAISRRGLHLLEKVRLCSRGGWLGWWVTFPPGRLVCAPGADPT
jgi:hypothetical protein